MDADRQYILDEVDKDIRRFTEAGVPPTCKKGCSNCCYVQITCMPEEVEAILATEPLINIRKLKAQVEDWDSADKSCVLLADDGSCGVHPVKPVACIAHLVNSPAERCAIDSPLPPHYIRTKAAVDKIKELYQTYGTVKLHEGIYERLFHGAK